MVSILVLGGWSNCSGKLVSLLLAWICNNLEDANRLESKFAIKSRKFGAVT